MRGAYSEILGMDPEFCALKDVELLLWKNCYYKRIEVGQRSFFMATSRTHRLDFDAVESAGCNNPFSTHINDPATTTKTTGYRRIAFTTCDSWCLK